MPRIPSVKNNTSHEGFPSSCLHRFWSVSRSVLTFVTLLRRFWSADTAIVPMRCRTGIFSGSPGFDGRSCTNRERDMEFDVRYGVLYMCTYHSSRVRSLDFDSVRPRNEMEFFWACSLWREFPSTDHSKANRPDIGCDSAHKRQCAQILNQSTNPACDNDRILRCLFWDIYFAMFCC